MQRLNWKDWSHFCLLKANFHALFTLNAGCTQLCEDNYLETGEILAKNLKVKWTLSLLFENSSSVSQMDHRSHWYKKGHGLFTTQKVSQPEILSREAGKLSPIKNTLERYEPVKYLWLNITWGFPGFNMKYRVNLGTWCFFF